MSYLNALRLHFAGQFQANVSTVNNDPTHFDNAAFQGAYQDMQGPNMNPANGWFNPQGDAAFRLLGCTVTSAWMPSGRVGPSDPVLGYIVADADGRAPAKLVDLDPEQQMVSTIWGLQVRIADAGGNMLMRGEFEPAAFIDIWNRATGGGGDVPMGAMWQSVLRNLRWGDVSGSDFLKALQHEANSSGRLSIKFNTDGINMDYTSTDFMCGRIVGTIGPSAINEPAHMVIGRQFMAKQNPLNLKPVHNINYCAGVVDKVANCIFLDLGNALSTSSPGGPINDLGDLSLFVDSAGGPVTLGTIPATGSGGYTSVSWYTTTAGVVALPLTGTQLQDATAAPLTIKGNKGVSISEWSSGAFVRADAFVYRMSPGETIRIPVYAMQWGKALPNAQIGFALDSSQLQPGSVQGGDLADGPPVATPDILTFASTATTDGNGVAILSVTAGDPGNVRWFNNGTDYGIDGQVYGIRPAFVDTAVYTGDENPWNFISLLVWSDFIASYPQTWTDLQPVFKQYANLYPVMNRFLDLGDYESVIHNIRFLKLTFGLEPEDPNAMPVTRDLSPAKRNAILAWLQNPLPGPVPHAAPVSQPVAVRPALAAAASAGPSSRGGKSAAAARRLALRTQ
jgi:hypothetical protein